MYACCILGCDSAAVGEPDELNRCENCGKKVCQGHSRKRSTYVVCSECDEAERERLQLLIAEPLENLVAQIRQGLITAETLEVALGGIVNQVADLQA